MRSAVWNELPDDAAGPVMGPPGVAMSVPATDFLGTLMGLPQGRRWIFESGDYSNFTEGVPLWRGGHIGRGARRDAAPKENGYPNKKAPRFAGPLLQLWPR
jgi:hypothetical protein